MKIEPFQMERMQSTYENLVEYNLSESGVHPMTLRELIPDPGELQDLLEQPLAYTQSNGTLELRSSIATLYEGAGVDHIEVTNGGSEANYIVTWNLVEPGDEVVVMVPNYMQTWGLARSFGATVREWPLTAIRGGREWRADTDRLKALVNRRTKLIIVCNPNNPTGGRLTADELNQICEAASTCGAWILADEIYRGAERDGGETPTVWGRYDRAIVTNGLSKAYGLPGLRIGWIAGPIDVVGSLWSYHDYTTIAPGALSDRLARVALSSARRPGILERTRSILRQNYEIVRSWLDGQRDRFTYAPPEAGAIAYVQYHHAINSTDLVNRLRTEKNVLIVPGDHFGMDGYLRIGFGVEPEHLRRGLGRVQELLSGISLAPTAGV